MLHVRSIQHRLVLFVSLGLLLFSVLAGWLLYRFSFNQEMQRAASLEQQIVTTVKTQAEVAVFASNYQIAEGVIEGLRANPGVKAVHILSTEPGAFEVPVGPANRIADNAITDYPLFSPIDGTERIGTLAVIRNDHVIIAGAQKMALRQLALMALQVLAAAMLIVLLFRQLVGNPITSLARSLAAIKPGSGDKMGDHFAQRDDEIGSLAQSANTLIGATEAALADVQAKTRQIEQQHQLVCHTLDQIATLLNNSDEGFLSFGADFRVNVQYSLECERIFGGPIAGRLIHELLCPDNSKCRDFLFSTLGSVVAEKDSYLQTLYLGLLPTDYAIGSIRLNARYRLLENGSIIAMLTDVTEQMALQERINREQQRLRLIVEAVKQHDDMLETVWDFQHFLSDVVSQMLKAGEANKEKLAALFRQVHTFKGVFSQFEFHYLPPLLHQFESELSRLTEDWDDFAFSKAIEQFLPQCLETLESDLSTIKSVLGEDFCSRNLTHAITEDSLKRIENRIGSMSDANDRYALNALVKELRFRPLREMLDHLPDYIADLATRLDKLLLPVTLEGGEFRVDPERFSALCKSMIHVFRNAVDHGIELPDERVELGKPEAGQISCNLQLIDLNVVITIADDGRGIDADKIAAKAASKRITWTRNVYDLIFEDAFSTCDNVSTLSGRGVGLSAVREEVRKLNGSIEIETRKGAGTTFKFIIPLKPFANAEEVRQHHLLDSVAGWAATFLSNHVGIAIGHTRYEMEHIAHIDMTMPTAFMTITASGHDSILAFCFDSSLVDHLISFNLGEIPDDRIARNLLANEIAAEMLNIVIGNATENLQSWDSGVRITPPSLLDAPKRLQCRNDSSFFTATIETEVGQLRIHGLESAAQFDESLNYLEH